MIELRYLGAPHFLKLQYRSLIPSYHASGAWGEPSVWSDWMDVPVINDADAAPVGSQASGIK